MAQVEGQAEHQRTGEVGVHGQAGGDAGQHTVERQGVVAGDANTVLQPVVRQAIDNGYPIIVLFYFSLSDPSSGHFSPVIAYDETGCTRANTWNGLRETWDWPTFEKWQKQGNCLVLKRTRAPDLPVSTNPSLDHQARPVLTWHRRRRPIRCQRHRFQAARLRHRRSQGGRRLEMRALSVRQLRP